MDDVTTDGQGTNPVPPAKSVIRPGVVRVVGRVAPRQGYQRPNGSAGQWAGRPVDAGFNGVVDDRVIPDAGVPTEYVEGFLDVTPDGHGYLRPKMIPSSKDVYISASQVRRFFPAAGRCGRRTSTGAKG